MPQFLTDHWLEASLCPVPHGPLHGIAHSLASYFVRAIKREGRDLPGGAVVKNPPANAGDTGSSPGLGRSHMPRSN